METARPAILAARDEHFRRATEKLTVELGQGVMAHLNDPTVIEIVLNPDGTLWVEQLGQPMRQFGRMSATQAESLMATVASTLRTQITPQNPILECELPIDGSRFEALIPPVVSAPTFAIRKKASQVFPLADYLAKGALSAEHLAAIADAVRDKRNILVAGGTGSGKTTLTNAIIREVVDVAPDDRVVIIEDTGELQCAAANNVKLRAVEQVDMTRLLKATLRLRPTRIIVGEVRDGAALALLMAWNTGHPGGVATVHANSARAALTRLELLVSMATEAPMKSLIAEAVDLIIFIETAEGGRRIKEIVAVEGHDGEQYITISI